MSINRDPDIEAEITFIPTERGGKTHAAWQNYRVDHDFGIPDMLNVAQHEFVGCNEVEPGKTVKSKLWFMSPELQNKRLYPGFKFTVQEGSRIVAHGIVLNVINPELKIST
jgi:translation elongation factor EF-Tu-like GTPase